MVAYYRPSDLDEALAIQATADVTILAGGTDIYPAKATRAGWGHMRHKDVLDISAVAELRGISEAADCWRLGALTTWSALAESRLPPCFDGLKLAARAVGGRQVQNRGTLVGNICTASPAGDGIPNLLVLNAQVELASRNRRRRLPLAAFIDGYRHTACAADEIVTALLVPKQDQARSGFLKLGARSYLVISIAMAAGLIALDEEGRITTARLAVGACSAVASRLPALEARLIGRELDKSLTDAVTPDVFAHLAPIDDIRASGRYRLAAAETLTRDLVAGFAERSLRSAA